MNNSSKTDDRQALKALWSDFAVCFGAITIIAVFGMWVHHFWLPLIALFFAGVLYTTLRIRRARREPYCFALTSLTIISLLATAAVLSIIEFWLTPAFFKDIVIRDPGAPTMPYLGSLIVYPITFATMLYGTLRGFNLGSCVDCHQHYGTPAERGFTGQLYSQEGLFMRSTITSLSGVMTAVCWIYFLLRFVNTSFNKADTFAFIIMPALVYAAALIGIGIRFACIWYYYNRDVEGSSMRQGRFTKLRYIIICGNEIFLHVPSSADEIVIGDEKVDTPVKLTIGYTSNMLLHEARHFFLNFISAKTATGVTVRPMYATNNSCDHSNMFHYLVFIDSKEVLEKSHIRGTWFTILAIKEMLDKGECSKLFGAEITRLHTIAMAWKTYDRNGRRLYRIKHYVPTFRISDIHKWDVDYNDPHWLFVSRNNEDRALWRLRRLWHRFIKGYID